MWVLRGVINNTDRHLRCAVQALEGFCQLLAKEGAVSNCCTPCESMHSAISAQESLPLLVWLTSLARVPDQACAGAEAAYTRALTAASRVALVGDCDGASLRGALSGFSDLPFMVAQVWDGLADRGLRYTSVPALGSDEKACRACRPVCCIASLYPAARRLVMRVATTWV